MILFAVAFIINMIAAYVNIILADDLLLNVLGVTNALCAGVVVALAVRRMKES